MLNIIIKDISLMVDTERGTCCHFQDGTIGINISGLVRIDKEGNILSTEIEQDRD